MKYFAVLIMCLMVACGAEPKKTYKSKECVCEKCDCKTEGECECTDCECSCGDRSGEGGSGDPCEGGSCPPPSH